VSAVALAPSVTLGFATGASATATVSAGQTASYSLVLNSTNYAGTVTITCAGAPAGYTCNVPAPATLTTATSTTAVAISVQTPSTVAAVESGQPLRIALAVGMILAPLALLRKRRGWMMTMAIVAVVGLCAANGCGSSVGSGSGGGGSTTPVTSMLTISAAGTGLTTATQQLTLTVQ